MKKEKKIPTILGLLFLLASTFVGIYLSSKKVNIKSNASDGCRPDNIQITNITHSSLAISFITPISCESSISIDNRIIAGFTLSSRIHYFSVDGLEESNEYRFSIIAGGTTFEETSYFAKTAKKVAGTAPPADIAWGKVFNSDGSPGAYSIIYVIIPQGSPLSALVTSNGNWNIPFANSYNLEKDNWFTPQTNINEDIYIISQDGQTTQITGNTSRNNPVPDIIIGQDAFSQGQVDPSLIGNVGLGTNDDILPALTKILNPKNGETITTLMPDFFGTTTLNSPITISLSGPVNTSGSSVSDSTGTWHWSPTSNLIPGNYTIKAGTVEHNFIISSKMESLAYSASSSANIATPTTVFVPTPVETPMVYVSPTSTSVPTAAPTERAYKPSTSSGVPKTGASFPTIIIIMLSISLIILSFLVI